MAKKTDDSSARERLLQIQQEQKTLEEQVRHELEGQLEELVNQFDEFGFELPEFIIRRFRATSPVSARTVTSDKKDRQPRSCKICRAAGRDDLAPGHTARGHETWLEKQTADIQQFFKGQKTSTEPRLVATDKG